MLLLVVVFLFLSFYLYIINDIPLTIMYMFKFKHGSILLQKISGERVNTYCKHGNMKNMLVCNRTSHFSVSQVPVSTYIHVYNGYVYTVASVRVGIVRYTYYDYSDKLDDYCIVSLDGQVY